MRRLKIQHKAAAEVRAPFRNSTQGKRVHDNNVPIEGEEEYIDVTVKETYMQYGLRGPQ